MKAIKYINLAIMSLSILVLFSSCDPEEFFIKTIEFDTDITDPMLVINSIIYPDSLVKVNLSKSRFILEDDSYTIDYINTDATLNLYENEVFKEKLNFVGDGNYHSVSTTQIGSVYKIEAIHPDFETATAETKIPIPIEQIRKLLIYIDSKSQSFSTERVKYLQRIEYLSKN